MYMIYFDVVCEGLRYERETTSESGEELVEEGEVRVAHCLEETLKPCEREGGRTDEGKGWRNGEREGRRRKEGGGREKLQKMRMGEVNDRKSGRREG